VGHIGEWQQGDLRTVKGAATRRRAGFRRAAAGFLFVVVLAGRFIEQPGSRSPSSSPHHLVGLLQKVQFASQ
jgi:hypothetical protein